MKKIVALALCVVMVLGLLSGCQKPMDAQTLAQKMDEAVKDQTAMAAKLDMELDMTMGITGMTLDMGIDMAMDLKADMAKGNMYVDMDADMEVLGESQDMSMEIYGVTEGDTMTMYMYQAAADTWVKSQEESFTDQAEELKGVTITMSEIPAEKMTLAEEKELVNDRECYVLTVDIDGTYFDDAMKLAMEAGMEELDEESKAMLERIDWSKLNAKMVYHVDAETFIAVQMTGEILGMGDVMNSMLGEAMGELMAMLGGEDVEFTVDIPVCKIAMTDVSYGDVEIPAVPQEAIDNAIDADAMLEEPIMDDGELGFGEPQVDSSYLMFLNNAAVWVTLPEGYPYVIANESYLEAQNEEETTYMIIDMVEDYTVEEADAGFLAQMEELVESGDIESHSGLVDMEGFRTISCYVEGVDVWYAWRELDGCMMMFYVETVDEAFDMAGLLSGVEPIES